MPHRPALTTSQLAAVGRGMQALQRGELSIAEATVDALLSDGCLAADVHHLAALCHASRGIETDASRSFEAAVAVEPDHPLIRINYAAWLRKRGEPERALSHLQHAVTAAPDLGKAWADLGALQFQRQHFDEAINALQRALAVDDRNAHAWHLLGNTYRAIDDLPRAEQAFRQVLTLSPGHRTATLNLAAVLRLSGRSDEAVQCLGLSTDAGTNSPEWMDTLAGALLDSGDVEAATEVARQLIARFPLFAPGHTTYANLVLEYDPAGTRDAALAPLRLAVRERPLDMSLRCEYARLLLATGQPEAALVELRAVADRHRVARLVGMEAAALDQLGRPDEAGRLFERARAGALTEDVQLLKGHGRHLLARGDWERAARLFERAVALVPRDQEAWAYLGSAWRLTAESRSAWLCDEATLVGELDVACPAGYSDIGEFLEVVRTSLEGFHRAQREPMSQSVKGGSQTPGRLFGRRDPVLQTLHGVLRDAVHGWLETLPTDDGHPFLARNTRRTRITGSWSVKLRASGRHENHMHPEGWLSSAFYVALPSAVAANDAGKAGWLQFGAPPDELGLDLPPSRQVCPAPGKLVVFPSYFWHGTVPFESTQSRMTVAFDAVPADHE